MCLSHKRELWKMEKNCDINKFVKIVSGLEIACEVELLGKHDVEQLG